ncbi:tetratricopeptide repeat protein [bacterium]|nr:tetratricopeptide repeat protein [bacterium]
MAEQISIESIVFETARKYHENYLLKSQEQDLQEAIENYVEVLTLNPEHAQCYYRLASLMYESGQITLESTIEQCQKAIALNPKNINAYIYAGYYLEQAQNYTAAEKIFKDAIKLTPFKSARARLILASTIRRKLEQQGFNPIEASKAFYYTLTGCLTLVTDFSALKMISKSFADDTIFKFYQAVGTILEKFNTYKVLDFYKKSIQKTQRSEFFYDKIARFYIKNNDCASALNAYKESYKQSPNNKFVLQKLAQFIQQYYPEKIDDIIDCYTSLLDLEEDDLSPIYYELGYLYLQKEDKINAVGAFKLALEGNEENPYYNDALAYAYVQAELYDDAIEYYQRAIKLNPDRLWTVNVCHSLGLIYQKCKENYEAAIASFQAGAILDPKNEKIILALADVYAIQNDFDSAIKTYTDVIALNPKNYEAYSKLGIVLADKKMTKDAISAYKTALEINPEHEISYNNLGIIFFDDLKDCETALEFFDKALEINPSYTLAYFNKGRVLQYLNNFADAAKNYQMSFDLNRITNVLDEKIIQNKLSELFNV